MMNKISSNYLTYEKRFPLIHYGKKIVKNSFFNEYKKPEWYNLHLLFTYLNLT